MTNFLQWELQEYQTALSKAKVITNTTDATRVKNVGIRIKMLRLIIIKAW